jgi:hypothetical protein
MKIKIIKQIIIKTNPYFKFNMLFIYLKSLIANTIKIQYKIPNIYKIKHNFKQFLFFKSFFLFFN